MKTRKYKVLIFLVILLFLSPPARVEKYEFPVFTVVLDPGHGGAAKQPRSQHGDRYDPISGKYLDDFRDGASLKKVTEHLVVYSVAQKAEKILRDAAPGGDFKKFKKILKKYTNETPKRISILTHMSRGPSLTENEKNNLPDPNAKYRMFDYPDSGGDIQPGRISQINSLKPQLVVSIHLAGAAPVEYVGINPVIAAPYSLLYQGLLYLRGDKKAIKRLKDNPPDIWFSESWKRTHFKWFLNDVSLYFTSYPLKKNLTVRYDKFKGYRYNMVNWHYGDGSGWTKEAAKHLPKTQYSRNYLDVVPSGKFWERERSVYEKYRREGGKEGFGGDNAYASYEIIRYILYSLDLGGLRSKKHKPGKPFRSIWIMPLHLNAINAFVELGYINRRKDRFILTKKHDEIAEGIAVGIYSLFSGLKLKERKFKHTPKGKKIDLERYQITKDKSYFDIVAE
ncbi:MAG: N-acetylmuramoyl-L-alanine amidase [bacterium]|nr:N-acetylmuramoyl-L-alanine amidase [bacterium]